MNAVGAICQAACTRPPQRPSSAEDTVPLHAVVIIPMFLEGEKESADMVCVVQASLGFQGLDDGRQVYTAVAR